MKKQIVGLLLVAAMLSGCGTADNAGTAKPSEDSKAVSSETSKETSKETVKESEYPDYLNLDGYRPIVKEGEEITLTAFSQRSGMAESDVNEDIWFTQFVEQVLNINMEIDNPRGEAIAERKSLMFASGELPDLLLFANITNAYAVNYGIEGQLLLPLSDYFSEELTPNILAFLEENPSVKAEITAPDGKIYAMPNLGASVPGAGDSVAGNDKLWLDKAYMEAIGRTEVPQTLDEFVEMLREIKALNPADFGVDEIWPLVATMGYDRMYFNYAFGWISADNDDLANPFLDTQTGEVVVPVAQEEKFSDYVKLYHTLYTEGLIHEDYFTLDTEGQRALIAEKCVGVVGDATTDTARPGEEDNFLYAGALTSKWSDKAVLKASSALSTGVTAVSADTEYPELCLRLIDYLYTPEGSLYSMHGPLHGSEDCLGMTEGISYDAETKTIIYHDVESGEFEGSWPYMVQKLKWAFNSAGNENLAYEHIRELSGLSGLEFPEPSATAAKQMYEAAKGHLVSKLPGVYMDAETTTRYTDLYTVLNDHLTTEFAKFVVGQRSLDELPKFFEELKAMGLDEYVQMVNDAYTDFEWDGVIK